MSVSAFGCVGNANFDQLIGDVPSRLHRGHFLQANRRQSGSTAASYCTSGVITQLMALPALSNLASRELQDVLLTRNDIYT